MKYAKITNNEIELITKTLPKNIRKVSGLHLLSEEERKVHGWYTIQEDNTILGPWQKLDGPPSYAYDSGSDSVIETKNITNISLQDYMDIKISSLKSATLFGTYNIIPQYKRDQINSQVGGFDWGLTLEYMEKAQHWLKAHKDQVDVIEQQILNAQDHETIKALPNIVVIDFDTFEVPNGS